MAEKKPLHKMTLTDRLKELLNDEPKTMFRILQLLPSSDDLPENSIEENELNKKLHNAKFVCVQEAE